MLTHVITLPQKGLPPYHFYRNYRTSPRLPLEAAAQRAPPRPQQRALEGHGRRLWRQGVGMASASTACGGHSPTPLVARDSTQGLQALAQTSIMARGTLAVPLETGEHPALCPALPAHLQRVRPVERPCPEGGGSRRARGVATPSRRQTPKPQGTWAPGWPCGTGMAMRRLLGVPPGNRQSHRAAESQRRAWPPPEPHCGAPTCPLNMGNIALCSKFYAYAGRSFLGVT
jgi:hypothetical protein